MSPRIRVFPVVALVGATACWGVGTVISKHALATIEPLTLLAVQLLSSTVVLFVAVRVRQSRLVWTSDLRRLAALGVLNPGLAYALGLLGLRSISASMSVLIWAAEPVLILVLAAILLSERVSGPRTAALVMAVLGVVLVVYRAGARGSTVGVMLTVAAVAACAFYTVAARGLLTDDDPLVVVLVQQAAALGFAALLLAGAAGSVGSRGIGAIPAAAWVWAVVSGLLYYGISYSLYLTGLGKVSASAAGSFLPLVPVFGVTTALLVGERLDVRQWIGAAIVVASVAAIALLPARPSTSALQPPGRVSRE
jgi:probable blue pigment (indigoidine) exporter